MKQIASFLTLISFFIAGCGTSNNYSIEKHWEIEGSDLHLYGIMWGVSGSNYKFIVSCDPLSVMSQYETPLLGSIEIFGTTKVFYKSEGGRVLVQTGATATGKENFACPDKINLLDGYSSDPDNSWQVADIYDED